MTDLFQTPPGDDEEMTPLAARMRPKSLDDIVGQEHLIGPGKVLRVQIERDRIFSSIFWGPPGSGKTTLAMLMAKHTKSRFIRLSAVGSGVADVRKVIEAAKGERDLYRRRTILFIDEIHRFNKAQQDVLLPAVERGLVILIGATTENPSYEVIPPLRSRTRTLRLLGLEEEQVLEVIDRALSRDVVLKRREVELDEDAGSLIADLAGGDARRALNILEMSAALAPQNKNAGITVTLEDVRNAAQSRGGSYDKAGDRHYDIISAFIKSVRGSDPDAALIWLAKMLTSGESPIFIARRLLILASEDIGNADPMGLLVAASGAKAIEIVGMPEANLILSQMTTYLACAKKSNASCLAIGRAEKLVVDEGERLQVPPHLRSSSFAAAEAFGHGVGYKYPHSFEDHIVRQDYLPEHLLSERIYQPTEMGHEAKIGKWLEDMRNKLEKREETRREAEQSERQESGSSGSGNCE
ncbi:replication-associated recombination protein A [bacterium]|nr:replication-associated recombination protein A [bacterium]